MKTEQNKYSVVFTVGSKNEKRRVLKETRPERGSYVQGMGVYPVGSESGTRTVNNIRE